jgi:hypothetical protein
MKIKVNDKWYSVKSIEYYASDKTDFVGKAAPKEVKDIELDSDSGYSYKDLEKMHVDYDCPESDVQESMNDYDAAIAPLAERISKLEELMRQIILALGIYKDGKDALASRDLECLQERVNAFEQHYLAEEEQKQFEIQQAALQNNRYEYQVADASKIDWEQRRYEVAKACVTTIFASDELADYGALANRAVNLADCVIANLKSREK